MNYGAASAVSEHFDDLLFKKKILTDVFWAKNQKTPFVTLKVGSRTCSQQTWCPDTPNSLHWIIGSD